MIDKSENLLVVDENNNPIEPAQREEVHSKGYWHRTSHVWIVNLKNELLCQKRSMLKDKNPSKWEPFFGGHLGPNEDYRDVAVKEANEELNLGVEKKDLVEYKIVKSDIAKLFIGVYKFIYYGSINDIKFDKSEVEQIKWIDIDRIKHIKQTDKERNWTNFGYEEEALGWLTPKG